MRVHNKNSPDKSHGMTIFSAAPGEILLIEIETLEVPWTCPNRHKISNHQEHVKKS